MITIQAEFTQKQCDLGLIGRVGENASRQIVFDCAEALRAFPGADILCDSSAPRRGRTLSCAAERRKGRVHPGAGRYRCGAAGLCPHGAAR